MKIDTKLPKAPYTGRGTLAAFAESAQLAETRGYHGVLSTESAHDPFLPLVAAAQATSAVQLGTAIAVAFARNPMSLAYSAHDLQLVSEGRFMLGLGSQVRPHIERRFDMPWGRPAARMREFVEALRAVWDAWNAGRPLDFRGEFYSHTLMTPFFSPEPSPWGPPEVYLAAVGEQMTSVAGAVCDGIMPHPFTTERYLRERTLPTLRAALARAGRTARDCAISLAGFVVSGATEEEMAAAADGVRRQIAFYGSTPAYSGVLELHGWGSLGEELTTLARTDDEDRWRRMGELIDDEVLAAFAIIAEPDRVGAAIEARYGDVVDRFSFYAPYPHEPELWRPALEYLTSAVAA